MSKRVPSVKKLRPLQLAAIIFLTISGGPYGLESLISYVGDHGVFILLIITPILWDIPTIFTILELNSMMPVTGGYYQWVKHAMGLRFAWYEGWWTWLYTFVDLAIYPVLFVEYLGFFFPGAEAYKIPVCLVIIWSSALLNIRGIVPVGKFSVFLGIIILAPFFILFFYFLFHHSGSLALPSPSLEGVKFPALGLALYTVMWNFLGWDNVTTYAEEVTQPVRTYLVSVFTAFSLIFIVYFMALFISIQSGMNPETLSEEGFPALGVFVGGQWLGALIAVGGLASGLGLYSAVLLSVSRIPKVMSDDELLPPKLHKLHPRFGTPYISIICCSLVVSVMIMLRFADLLIIDVILYGAALFLEFVALIILRKREPDRPRPFKIPLNIAGLCIMFLLPVGVYVIALTGAFSDSGGTFMPVVIALATLLSAEVIWRVIVWRKPHLKKP
ncbi:MAG: family permease [Bacteroidetes bacterium]|nr:family permease [Bacteroidota bacterium]